MLPLQTTSIYTALYASFCINQLLVLDGLGSAVELNETKLERASVYALFISGLFGRSALFINYDLVTFMNLPQSHLYSMSWCLS